VRLNNGQRRFLGGSEINGGGTMALGDVDADGDLDLLVGGTALNVRLNNGRGVFTAGQPLPTPGAPVTDLALHDVDGDGDLDLLTVGQNNAGVTVYRNNGAGTFTNSQLVAVGTAPLGLALADVDGDGTLDLLAANTTGQAVSVRLNRTVLANAPAPVAEQVSLYPNPARGSVRLRLPAELAKQRLQIQVVNTLGQVVLTHTLPAQPSPELALPQLAAGLYSLQLQTTLGLVTKRLVVE
jgi:hypothetical protein